MKRITAGFIVLVILTLTLLWALPAARAQQTTLPMIGYLSSRSPSESAHIVAAFRQGLKEVGFVEGQNVAIESRFAEGHFDRLPELAAELVRRQVNVLVATGGTVSVVKAKPVVPATIPIVFAMGGDPVKLGVVASLAQPGGNITGVSFLVNELAAKTVELLHELLPNAGHWPYSSSRSQCRVHTQGRRPWRMPSLHLVCQSRTESEISPLTTSSTSRWRRCWSTPSRFHRPTRKNRCARCPRCPQSTNCASLPPRGLMTYGTSYRCDRQLGVYTGRVLKGTKPVDLPVMQSMKFELIINLKTAQALGFTIPLTPLPGG